MNHSYEEKVLELIRRLKRGEQAGPASLPAHPRVTLEPVTWADADEPQSIHTLAEWRKKANPYFPAQFPVSEEGTHRWLVHSTLEVPDRLLLWAVSAEGQRTGHLGLFRFDFTDRSVELDNVVRGVEGVLPGLMQAAVESLLVWTFETLAIDAVYLRVLSDNERALRLYQRCGFQETMRMPLVREQEGDAVRWVEAQADHRRPVTRYFVTMRLLATERRQRKAQLAGPHHVLRATMPQTRSDFTHQP
ncbi:MAG TPA: GNAT family N-acetyltransferase [Pirellulales bacterium]|nr:GNAT family N-acetyltransferase [Pirellulales bacterium]